MKKGHLYPGYGHLLYLIYWELLVSPLAPDFINRTEWLHLRTGSSSWCSL